MTKRLSVKERVMRLLRSRAMWLFVAIVACLAIQQLSVEWHAIGVANSHLQRHLPFETIVRLLLNATADSLLLALPFVVLRGKWRRLGWVVVVLHTVWCVVQLLYLPTYRDLMPFASFLMVQNVDRTLVDSALGSWQWGDLEAVLPPVLLVVLYWKLGKDFEKSLWHWRKRLTAALVVLVVIIGAQVAQCAIYFSQETRPMSLKEMVVAKYCHKGPMQFYYYFLNGFSALLTYDIWEYHAYNATLDNNEKKIVADYLASQPHYTDNNYATAQGKNIIFVVVESLNSWVINLEAGGREVTPTLNKLCADTTNNIVCTHVVPQVKGGHSSDGMFIYHTGLLPLTNRVAAMLNNNSTYQALPRALGGYDAMYLCCEGGKIWNVETMAQCYGYSHIYCGQETLAKVDKDKADSVVFAKAATLVPELKQPFLALLSTFGMHFPYNKKFGATWLDSCTTYSEELKNYLAMAAEMDHNLSLFLENMKSKGLLDNTVLIVASDHNDLVDQASNGRPSIDKQGTDCVLIIANAGQGKFIAGPVGQVDVFPTILDLMGANKWKWKGLGHSLMRHDITSAATSSATTEGSSNMLKRQMQAWQVSELMIRSSWLK